MSLPLTFTDIVRSHCGNLLLSAQLLGRSEYAGELETSEEVNKRGVGINGGGGRKML